MSGSQSAGGWVADSVPLPGRPSTMSKMRDEYPVASAISFLIASMSVWLGEADPPGWVCQRPMKLMRPPVWRLRSRTCSRAAGVLITIKSGLPRLPSGGLVASDILRGAKSLLCL